jgi:potassium/hydrogen antiporter
MANVPLTFFFLAVIILLGFATARIFQSTRIPDIPILLSVGLLVGPLNRYALEHGFGSQLMARSVHLPTLEQFAPFVSSLALVVILFDSGLKLDFAQFGRSIRPSFVHTFPVFVLTVFLLSLVGIYVFGMPVLLAVILAVALSNVGQTVSAAIIRQIDLDQETRSIYFVEMAIYDLISIPLLVGLLEFAQEGLGAVDGGQFARSLTQVISISLLLGVAGGLLWIYVLLRLQSYPYSYMVTLAMLLLVYSLNSFLGGSGPVSVLIFGLVIGNRVTILRLLHRPSLHVAEGEKVHSFHDEITFFVRAFFFIFLGVSFTTTSRVGDAWPLDPKIGALHAVNNPATLFLIGVLFIFIGILAARYLTVRFISTRGHPERWGLLPVYGRGLGTAVLATFPFTLPAYQAGSAYHAVFSPWEGIFRNVALFVILLTVTGSALTVWLRESRLRQAARQAATASDPLNTVKE